MASRTIKTTSRATSRAIDLMYFHSPKNTLAIEDRCHEFIEPLVDLKKDAGVDYVFITQCKRWSCDRRIYCEDAHLYDVLRYTYPYPDHFIGLAGYNPLNIATSLQEADIGIKQHGFRGVYVCPGSFGIVPNDRRMYPLYAKAAEWQTPVILDLRFIADGICPITASEMARVAVDFPDVNFVIAQSEWTAEELSRLAENEPNIYFCFDTAALLAPHIRSFVNSAATRSRTMWGSNGLPWKEALAEVARLEFSNTSRLLRDNAMDLFGLHHLPKRRATKPARSESKPLRILAE